MAPFPLLLTELLGQYGAYLVFLLVGIAFGYALEIAGFGNSKLLAAQFYFKDLTVLKVMFTAIIVAMVLIFLASGLGLLDYNLVWVNPTYLVPGIVGGIIMGFGFIIGGFCPGTSLVSMATFKTDGLYFVLGVLSGIFIFGETVDFFPVFWNSTYMGRFTLMDFLGLPTGITVLLVVLMALFMFWGGEQLERIIGGKDLSKAPKSRYIGAAVLVAIALATIAIGQPSAQDRWNNIAEEKQLLIDERTVYIHPGELLNTFHDHQLNLILLDVRSETDYNNFHLADAKRTYLELLKTQVAEFHLEPPNTVFVLMSNDETEATEAWKLLQAESVSNVYVLEGGINNWLSIFAEEDGGIVTLEKAVGDDVCAFEFADALGSSYHSSYPEPDHYDLEYTPKIKLELKRGPSSGGCG